MKSTIFIFAIGIIPLSGAGQSKVSMIKGVVSLKTSDYSKKPLAGASVYIPGIAGIATTNTIGYFELNLSRCQGCRAGDPVKIYINSPAGYTEKTFILSGDSNHSYDIDFPENTKIVLLGTVKDKKNGKFLKGIKVTAIMQDMETEPPFGITNDQGIFRIIIRKDGINAYQAVELVFSDVANGKYRDTKETVFINKIQTVDIQMEECTDCGTRTEMKIRRDTTTKISIDEGDLITVKAGGTIRVGRFVGTSGPDGRTSGVGGITLEDYNQLKEFNHAALLVRCGQDGIWRAYDKNKEMRFQADAGGYLEFKINDNLQSDNSGAYDVEIMVRK